MQVQSRLVEADTDTFPQPRKEMSEPVNDAVPPADDASKGQNGTKANKDALKPPDLVDEPLGTGDDQMEQLELPTPSSRRSYHRPRTSSIALSTTSLDGSGSKSAMVFIKSAMETIKGSKDAKKMPVLSQALSKVLNQFTDNPDAMPPPSAIMEPLRIVCAQGSSTEMRVVALDCIGKLFTFGYLDDEDPEPESEGVPFVPMVNRAVDIVCDTFDGESTDSRVELQIVKALTAAIVNEDLVIHGPTLLKAVRQIFHVFVISKSIANQNVAQVSLNQTVQVVFDRVKIQAINGHSHSQSAVNVSERSSTPQSEVTATESIAENQQLTLEQMKTTVEEEPTVSDDADLSTLDAFLLFRTLCKLSDKPAAGVNDFKSHAMKAKLVSLHLIHITLKQHISVFAAKNLYVTFRNRRVRFSESIKSYLWSSLSQNAASISPPVFEVSAEIFWLLLSNLRSDYKSEIHVFFKEVYFTILEMRTSTNHQKLFLLSVLYRLCSDPRALVELYLNYDCDANSSNIYELLINSLVKFAISVVPMSSQAMQAWLSERNHHVAIYDLDQPPSVSIGQLSSLNMKVDNSLYPREYAMKILALESLVSVSRSLHMWYQREAQVSDGYTTDGQSSRASLDQGRSDLDVSSNGDSTVTEKDTEAADDPSQFESVKSSKKALYRVMSEFNYKPDRGVTMMVKLGVIDEKDPEKIANILLNHKGFDLVKLGEYLGKEDPFNRKVMHHFVHLMEFKGVGIIEGLTRLLQQFRLPGEGQVVDRYIMEFANKYTHDNPTIFTSAETPYALGYSILLLNTDLHSARLRQTRMSFEDFVKNNRGINDGLDLPEDYLREIYDQIQANEIKLVSEHEDAAIKGDRVQEKTGWLGGKTDLNAEAYMVASEVITAKTARMFKTLMAKDRKAHTIYYNASHADHVHPMFDDSWMSMLAGFSGPFQQGDEPEVIELCLEGLYFATRIACHFDVELGRISFVQALARFASLANIKELGLKNVNAAITLLRIALSEGNKLSESWFDVVVLISQLERTQLIAKGVEAESLPGMYGLKGNGPSGSYPKLDPATSERLFSKDIVVASDKVFTQSANLNGTGIIDFVKALSKATMEEIAAAEDSQQPRLFCLQKMVDVCYYNMNRIRMEWSNIWALMGEVFNKVGITKNEKVVMFGLDSLRQLSIRFLDLDELSHFQFQKEFLKPFDYAMIYNPAESARTLVLDCLTQMIVSKNAQLRSGWITIFKTLSDAALIKGRVLTRAFEIFSLVTKQFREIVFSQDEVVLDSYLKCLATFAKQPNAKVALHALDQLNALVMDDDHTSLWYQLSKEAHDVIMHGHDLEVRGRALSQQFEFLQSKGSRFSEEEWDTICREQLFPLFNVLENKADNVTDDMNVWMSTTLVQALRSIVAIFKQYFDKLEHSLNDFFLDLLKTCITQENETVSRIGSSCLVQLVADNADRFADTHWQQVAGKIELIFHSMTAKELTEELLDKDMNKQSKAVIVRTAIQKCIQQLLLIETVNDLLTTDVVFSSMPIPDMVRINERVLKSYEFAHNFNLNTDLRNKLWQMGFMKDLPNLLMQESTAAKVFSRTGFRLFKLRERFAGDQDLRDDVGRELFNLSVTVLKGYNQLQASEHRQIRSAIPVVVLILQEVGTLEADDFKQNVGSLYMEVIEVLNKDMPAELRESVQAVLRRVAEVHMPAAQS